MVEAPHFQGYGKPTYHDVLIHYLFRIADATGNQDLEHMLISKLFKSMLVWAVQDASWMRRWDATDAKLGTLLGKDVVYTRGHMDLDRFGLLCELGIRQGVFLKPELRWRTMEDDAEDSQRSPDEVVD